ncbi:GDP-L-fucose synthase [subsurface metagenome]
MMNKDVKIFIAGHEGMIGVALVRCLKTAGFNNLITKSFSQLELTNQSEVRKFFLQEEPEYVFLAPVKEGGILANINYPAELIYINLQVQTNIIHFACETKVQKLLFLGSSCIYPKFCLQPMKEEALLTGLLEPTNEAYAIAKIAGIKLCQAYKKQYNTNFISVVPTNVYGPYDNFDLKTSHVIPGLIRKFHQSKINRKKEVIIWGSGAPRREFLFVDDFADACLFLMNKYDQSEIINVGYGKDISIRELALTIKEITGFEGELGFDDNKPDGIPNKLLDISKMNKLGWSTKTDLKEGLEKTYTWFKQIEEEKQKNEKRRVNKI